MAFRLSSRVPLAIVTSLLGSTLAACFDPTTVPLDTDTDADTEPTGASMSGTGNDDGGEPCTPGTTQACTCNGGASGVQTCLDDGTGFGLCECAGSDGATDTEPTDPDDTGDPPECADDEDCDPALGDACNEVVCDAGACQTQAAAAGTSCGSNTKTPCDAADTCDGAGTCVPNIAAQGVDCTGCGDDVCVCDGAGACGACTDFADGNAFSTDRSIVGWTLEGGWGLHNEAPQSYAHAAVPFEGRVFGTDGNRREPYPLGELEQSTATSTPFTLPATLTFDSWHVDEGQCTDNKQIFVSNDDGTSWTPLLDCCGPMADPVLCTSLAGPRAGDAWDSVSLPVPAPMVGTEGLVQFRYDTHDGCCDFEQGWFVDLTNIAPECACGTDATCGAFGAECGAGVCGGTGACELDAVAADTACGDDGDATCSNPDVCDGFGFCIAADEPNGHASCEECPSGICGGCVDGACVDCPSDEYDVPTLAGWVSEPLGGTASPGWGVHYSAPQNQVAGSTSTSFGARAPVIGTDGNRLAPYGTVATNLHDEHSQWTTPPFTVPAEITFESWNQDEGTTDQKRIELSVDGGLTWNQLLSCPPAGAPPCLTVNPRPIDQWDPIALDTSAWEGQQGQLRFFYDTQDACCAFERGWFINDLNVLTQCIDPIPAP